MTRFSLLCLIVAPLLSCSGGTGTPLIDGQRATTTASERPPAALVRVPQTGGSPTFVDAATLEPIEAVHVADVPPLATIWGIERMDGLLVGVTADSQAIAIELETGRTTVIASDVAAGTLSRSGDVYAVTSTGGIISLRDEELVEWESSFPSVPTRLLGLRNGRLMGFFDGLLILASRTQPAIELELPEGPVNATSYGDLVAVATDSGVVVLNLNTAETERTIRARTRPRSVAFSPSGHEVYVARQESDISIVNRFSGREMFAVGLPDQAAELRVDPYGRWLLARSVARDVVWVVDVAERILVGELRVPWDSVHPHVTPDAVIVAQTDSSLITFDPESLDELARTDRVETDWWIPTTFFPRRRFAISNLLSRARQSQSESGTAIFVQVDASHNPRWAGDAAQLLARAGLPARVLDPTDPDDPFRVVIGLGTCSRVL